MGLISSKPKKPKKPLNEFCKHLDINTNACKVVKSCIKKIVGLSSNSISPTETWILKFHQKTRYVSEHIPTGFMKWWISSYYVKNISKSLYYKALALEYETNVYKKVIDPLISKRITPNFARFLFSGKDCKISHFVNILNKDKRDNILRSLKYMINERPGRPSVTRTAPDYNVRDDDLNLTWEMAENMRYNTLINEAFTKNSTSLFSWLQKCKNSIKTDPSKVCDFMTILFQILSACYTMVLSKMNQNDLHMNNIWIEKLERPIDFMYYIDGFYYRVNTKYHVRVYDFDHAYVECLGINKGLSSKYNKFHPETDITKLILSMIPYLPESSRDHLMKVIRPSDKRYKYQDELSTFIPLSGKKGMLSIIAKIAKIGRTSNGIPRSLWYVCSPDQFKDDGSLK